MTSRLRGLGLLNHQRPSQPRSRSLMRGSVPAGRRSTRSRNVATLTRSASMSADAKARSFSRIAASLDTTRSCLSRNKASARPAE